MLSSSAEFSAVWTATIARKDAFFGIFENLHNNAAESVEICKISEIRTVQKNANLVDFEKIC